MDFKVQDMNKNSQNMINVLGQSKAMCNKVAVVVSKTHFKGKHITRKIDVPFDFPILKRQRRGLLGKILTTVLGVNE